MLASSTKGALLLAVALLLVAGDAEAGTPSLKIQAAEVRVDGPVEVKGVSNIKNIGLGIMQVRDTGLKTAMLIGTSSRAGAGPAQRFQPVEGSGVSVSASGETGGVFVAASTGRVGINDQSSKFLAKLHVKGGMTSDKIVAPYTGRRGPAMLLKRARQHGAVLLGKPESDKLRYGIGRQMENREFTWSVPSLADYDNNGKSPYIMFQSPKKVLAAFKAGVGNTYVAGIFGIKKKGPQTGWKSGTKSNLHVAGDVRLETKEGGALNYPRSGKNPSLSIRTGGPTHATAVDTKFFLTGGKAAVKVGVNTIVPKTRLDVRGHLNIQGLDKGNAVIYFPKGDTGFYIRSSDKPTGKDIKDTRFYIHPKGFTGINTVKPKYGLVVEAKSGTKAGEDVIITKGNLHINDGVADLDGVHKLELDGQNTFRSLDVETGVVVGDAKPHEGTTHVLHVKGSKAPKLQLSGLLMKPATVILQSGPKNKWVLRSTAKHFRFMSSNPKMPKVYFSKKGSFVVGGKEKAEFAFQLETKAKYGDPANSVWIGRGGLTLKGGIFKKAKWKGRWIVWRLYPAGFSNMKGIQIKKQIAIGTDKTKEDALFIEKGRTVDMGGFGFLHTTENGRGTLSFNEYASQVEGQTVVKVRNKKAYSAAMRIGEDGVTHFEASDKPGSLIMQKMLSINPAKGHATFEKVTLFGMKSSGMEVPLQVKGGGAKRKTSIAFGHISTHLGLLGSTKKFMFLGTSDEKKFVAIQHKDGHVGLGTTTATEELTIRTKKANSEIHFTSAKAPGKRARLTMEAGGSTIISTTAADFKSGKFEVKDFSELAFGNAGGKATTIFDRSKRPPGLKKGVKYEPPNTEFRSGNVGIGVSKADKNLHIGGDHWSQGRLLLRKGFARAMMSEFTELIQVSEEPSIENDHMTPEGDLDAGNMVRSLTKLVRKNKQRLHQQANTIAMMERQMSMLKAMRR